MDWAKEYKRIRRATWGEIAQEIHDRVTMRDAIAMYAPAVNIKGNRCQCPIHNGKDLNFSFTQSGYKCFVCGSSGDVIAFVKEVCELATRADAMRKLNQDMRLNLPIDGEVSALHSEVMALARQKAEERQKAIDAWEEEYADLMSCFCFLDRILMHPELHPVSTVCQANEKMAWIKWELEHMPSRPR